MQISYMSEEVILVDRDDRVVGSASKVDSHLVEHGPLLHRAFSVFLFDENKNLLLQQRATEKVTFPDYWTNTCCSHPLFTPRELGTDCDDPVEGARRAAVRKLEHELGLSIPKESLQYLTRLHYLANSSGQWGEHEIDYIFLAQLPRQSVRMNPNENEVRDVKWVSPSELKGMVSEASRVGSGLSITPWSMRIIEKFLFDWWDALPDVERFRDEKSIHRLGDNAEVLEKWEVDGKWVKKPNFEKATEQKLGPPIDSSSRTVDAVGEKATAV